MPTAPAPSTTMLPGTFSSSRTWSELRIRSPSAGAGGMSRGTEPVAIRMKRARRVWLPSGPSTTTSFGPVKRPVPWIPVTLFFLNRPSMPLALPSTTLRLRSCALAMSSVGSPTWIPRAAASRISSSTLAVWSRALVGMQPRCRQVPPNLGSLSTTATFIPSWPARIPAT